MGGGFFTRSLFRGSRRKVPQSTPENDSLDGDNDNDNDSVSSLGSGGLTAQSFRTPKGKKGRSWSARKIGPLQAAYGSPVVSGKAAAATYLEAAAAALGT